jgi:GNAT superfamily N-acetyltransferase
MYHIQTANIDDIPVIQQLTAEIWPSTYQSILTSAQIDYMLNMMYSTTTLTQQMTTGQQQFLLLYDATTPIGFAAYGQTSEQDVYKLHKIYLHGNYQGKGVGKLLINNVIERVKVVQGTILELDVNRENKARFFYEKQGFVIVKEKDTDIGNGYWMIDYVMRKPL